MRASRYMRWAAAASVLAAAGGGAPAAASDPADVGRWSSPFWEGGDTAFDPPSLETSKRFPTAGAATVLPDGRLLYWNALEASENGDVWVGDGETWTAVIENARTRLLDLGSGAPRFTAPALERGLTDDPQSGHATLDFFCADQKLLHDGRVLVAGGSRWDVPEDTRFPEPRGIAATSVFDPASGSFQRAQDMREPRWYPSLVTLADGRVLVASGTRRTIGTFMTLGTSFSQVRRTELYDSETRTWADGGVSDWSFPLYPRLHLLPDGTVFYGGTGQSWNPFGQTPDQATWSFRRFYDTERGQWRMTDHTRYGMRSGAASAMLRLEPPYDRADILVAGGALGASPSTWAATTLSEIVRWTPEGIADVGEVKTPLAGLTGDRTQLRHRRWFGTPVMLPTGEVLLVNGGDGDDVVDPGSAAPVRTPELYDPKTGTWSELAASGRDRVYHNTAVLLADGRVLVGGNAPHPAHYGRYGNQLSRNNNFRDSTFEIYEPPYLFRGPRPGVKELRVTRRGQALRLRLGRGTRAREVAEVVLVRMGSNTHSMDADMRAVKLEHAPRGRHLVARLPRFGDGRILPPGPYHVFAVRRTPEGPVPSIARPVLIQPGGGGSVVARRVVPR